MRRFDSAQAYHIGFDPMNRHSVLWGFLLFYVFQGKGDDTMVSFSLKVRFYETDLMGVVHHPITCAGLKWDGWNICGRRALTSMR